MKRQREDNFDDVSDDARILKKNKILESSSGSLDRILVNGDEAVFEEKAVDVVQEKENEEEKVGGDLEVEGDEWDELEFDEFLDEESEFPYSIFNSIREGSLAKVKNLFENYNAHVDLETCSYSVLHYAARYGRCDIVEYLVEQGADLNWISNDGKTPLFWAVEGNKHKAVQILLDAGADYSIGDVKGCTPLHKACRMGSLAMAKLFTEAGADINAKEAEALDKSSVLQEAVFGKNIQLIRYLIEQGADIGYRNKKGLTALHRAVFENFFAGVKLLIQYGSPVNGVDSNLRTPLHWAAFQGNLEIVKLLVENGSDISMKDSIGFTAKKFATLKKLPEIVSYLETCSREERKDFSRRVSMSIKNKRDSQAIIESSSGTVNEADFEENLEDIDYDDDIDYGDNYQEGDYAEYDEEDDFELDF
eukprot:TRINITY_DN640_c0_g1_i1.p1 TRINITY_DN640_c0_g1~~TRINITY_DN640_c0_g1_i1.p1  ORF type:complete len:420 (-),score=125.36 TRINITY_DN640_c0_g1_i1:952-2211(-)